jgi:hypothetical protein
MRLAILLLLTALLPAANAADVYRSVDKNGNVVFSDKPSEGAKKIEIPDAQTLKAPSASLSKGKPPPEQPGPRYSQVAITQPGNDQALRQNNGDITIHIAVSPSLKSGDVISLDMDGKEVASGTTTTIALKNVDRGTHTLQARVMSEGGQTWVSSDPVTFHLLRYSSIKPQHTPNTPLNPPKPPAPPVSPTNPPKASP